MKNRLPVWFKQDIPDSIIFQKLRLLSEFNVHTVCQEARCPNLSNCFKNAKLTFMLLGNTCTRDCRFCGVKKTEANNLGLDKEEPYRISQIVKLLGLTYVVITSVTRDDLADGGAEEFARTIKLIHALDKNIKVEALIPDFSGSTNSIKTVIEAKPCIVAHNLETVKRLYKALRPKASYPISLGILSKAKESSASLITKSSLILGLGETENEVIETMQDLRKAACDILTVGQYLAPSINHYPVEEFINIEQFVRFREIGLNLGFKDVLSGPKVRSSYQAEEVYKTCMTLS